ncbi:hypothetical protein HYC85_012964 [Camellia sinensis]|uniref:Uncharacterized protein n=1 Tax=Camellia sinensis TaxID=4442 RepID=A0A7J7HFH6_CAMSI|nr:hypothetical protein HYC85_012964 [Camellia sinensis]
MLCNFASNSIMEEMNGDIIFVKSAFKITWKSFTSTILRTLVRTTPSDVAACG